MFSIEHDFDATVITVVDDVPTSAGTPRQEDVAINAFDDRVTIEQLDPRTDEVQLITLSMAQVADIAAALDLPEGVYRRLRR